MSSQRNCVVSRLHRRDRYAAVLVLCSLAIALAGCDTDSFMDPSEVGRWENTPVVLPILERLDVIEEPEEQMIGVIPVRSEDLIPEIREYVMGPGDLITVTVFELITPGVETVQTRRIDELGYIRLPVIGQVKAQGLTTKQMEQRLIDILDPAILRNPTVTVLVQEGRQRTFAILGPVTAPGSYAITQNNFRLLDAIALARGLPPKTPNIYLIRQVPLSDVVEKGFQPVDEPPGTHKPPMTKTGMPSASGAAATPSAAPGAESTKPATLDPAALIENLSKGLDADKNKPVAKPGAPAAPEPGKPVTAPPLNNALEPGGKGEGRFVNINGKWVMVESAPSAALPGADLTRSSMAEGQLPPPDQLVTQRIIEVDAEALLRGEAKHNIVVRPNDIVRVPTQQTGNVFIGGHITRAGTYNLPLDSKMTLKQLVISAGGLAPVAIPERVDLIRRIGHAQEATVRLNLRAIYEGVQPDIFLKPDDTINVGTNFFASFLAVLRNSFRSSYGFGFILDRNFGGELFGQDLQR